MWGEGGFFSAISVCDVTVFPAWHEDEVRFGIVNLLVRFLVWVAFFGIVPGWLGVWGWVDRGRQAGREGGGGCVGEEEGGLLTVLYKYGI